MIVSNPDFAVKGAENIAQDALNKANQTDYTVTIAAQLSNMSDVFSMPATGVAVVHPRTNTVDLYFTASVENEPSSRPQSYNYLTLGTFCSQIGCAGLQFDPTRTIITLTRNDVEKGIQGRTGFKWSFFEDSHTVGGIGRVYSDNLSVIGTWSLSDGAPNYYVIRYGDVYAFTIMGAQMLAVQ